MDKTPIKVYRDKQCDFLKTPHSNIKRVLNITPANQPLSPKDVNVPTPAIFKPKKIQIPEIFSPISKIKSLTRKKYTVSNDENRENFETDDECVRYDAVTSTPIVPKRNRNYHNFIQMTPKSDKNVKVTDGKLTLSKLQKIKYGDRKLSSNYDSCNIRRNSAKETFNSELKSVLTLKQVSGDNEKNLDRIQSVGTDERGSEVQTEARNSFEEIKARFERVKYKAASTIDKSFLDKPQYKSAKIKYFGTNSQQRDIIKQSGYSGQEIIKNQAHEKSEIKSRSQIAVEQNQNEALPRIEQENFRVSQYESSKQDTGSNSNFYTALPDLTCTKRTNHLVSKNENQDNSVNNQVINNDISGVQMIPRSLNTTSMETESVPKTSQKMNVGNDRKPLTLASGKAKFESKIPKLNIDRSKKLEPPLIFIRDEDIDRITYKLNLGPSKSLNSTSKEKAALRSEKYTKALPEPKRSLWQNNEYEIANQCNHVSKISRTFFQSSFQMDSSNKVERNKEIKSEPRKMTNTVKIMRRNKSESQNMKRSQTPLTAEKKMIHNSKKQRMSFTSKNTKSDIVERHESTTKKLSCTKSISSHKENLNTSVSRLSGRISPISENMNEILDPPDSLDEICSGIKDTEVFTKPTLPERENQSPVNSTFVIQSSNSRYCYCSIPRINVSCPHNIVFSSKAEYDSEILGKSGKSSFEGLGECFKFRRKNTKVSSMTKSNLKRSFSFIHFNVKGNKYTRKSLLDLYPLSKSFPKHPSHSTDEGASPSSSNVGGPTHFHKKRKQLATERMCDKNLKEIRGESQKIEKSKKKRGDGRKHGVDLSNTQNFRSYSELYTQQYIDSIEPYVENIGNETYPCERETASIQRDLEKVQTTNSKKIIAVVTEDDYLSDESDACVVLTDDYLETQRIRNNEEELKQISEGVNKVENELVDLSKLHAEIKEDLVIMWECPNPLKSTSSSDNVSAGNVSVKDEDVTNGIPLRNAPIKEQIINEKSLESQYLPKIATIQNAVYQQDETLSKSSSSGIQSQPSRTSSQSSSALPSNTSSACQISSNQSAVPDKPIRKSQPTRTSQPPPLAPVQCEDGRERLRRDDYKIFLEEQNYRAIQMIESRLTRVEEKLSTLQSITLDIRNLLQVQIDYPNRDTKRVQEPPLAPPPPPPPPPPAPSERFFFPQLRSCISHNSSLSTKRGRSSPRNKSLRPAITVDDLRSVTLRKVSKETELTVNYPRY